VVVEFSDWQCPFCERFARDTLPRLLREYIDTGKVRFSYRNNPLTEIHPLALQASTAADCADQQGRFWDMHDAIFAHQRQLTGGGFVEYARAAQLDVAKFTRCLDAGTTARIQADQAEALRLGLQATPVFLIGRVDGRGRIKATKRIDGAVPYETFKAALDGMF
jgi:protein-disulfide isomerase